MTRSLVVAVGVVALAFPATASAASLGISPHKRCYSSGESVNLLGTGFAPLSSATVSRGTTPFPKPLDTDGNGAFNGLLGLSLDSGRETRTYTATDSSDPSLTASIQIKVSSVRVGLKPSNGAPGRILRMTARGFTTGATLWAHVTRGASTRNLKVGRLKGACGDLTARRRLLPRDAAVGVYTVQFDTFRRYRADRPVQDAYTITVSRF